MADGPLRGLRILDLTHVWAGPLATRILADLGAEILKLEAGTARGPAVVPDRVGGLYPGGVPGEQPWNRQAVFNKLNRNKKGLSVDLKTAEGRRLFLELVSVCDVVIENFSARAMKSLGLGYDALQAANPKIIYVAMPGYGTRGPMSDFVAFGPSVEPMTGLTSIMGYSESEPQTSAMALPDAVAGVSGAAAVLFAVYKRKETGEGSCVDLSLQEAAVNLVGEFLIERQLTGSQPPITGNRHRRYAPQGIYPCSGEDNWIMISCRNESEWQTLCEIVGGLEDDRFNDVEERRANHDALDERIAGYTRRHEKNALMEMLQGHGIPAGAVMTAEDFMSNRHIKERGFFKELGGDHVESLPYPGLPITIDGKRHENWFRAPCLGEHNEEVLSELLGMSRESIDTLKQKGVLADKPTI